MTLRRRVPLALLLAAAFLFRVGNAAAALALPWLALSHLGSAGWAGAAAASGVFATVVGAYFGGNLVDRWGPAPVSLVAGLVGALGVAAIPLLHAREALGPWSLLLLVAVGAGFDAPGAAAMDSRLPELGRLAGLSVRRVSTVKAFVGHGALLTGPLVAGGAIGVFGAAPTLWLTAALSLGAGLVAWRVLPRGRGRRLPKTQPGAPTGARAGFAHLWRDPLLGRLVAIITLFSATLGATAAIVLPALFQGAGRAAADYGLFVSLQGAGGLAGIVAFGALGTRVPPRHVLASAFAACAAVLLWLILLPPTGVLAALGLFTGLLTGPISPIFNTAVYGRTPPALRGRVLGALAVVVMGASPATLFGMGLGVERWGPEVVLVFAAALAFAAALLALRLRFPVSMERPDGPTQAHLG